MSIEFVNILVAPLAPIVRFFMNGNSRHFWLYVLTGLMIAAVAHRLSGDKRSFSEVFFARDVWLSRSAMNDYGILLINPLIQIVLFSWLLAHLNEIAGLITGGLRAAGVSGETTDGAALLAGLGLTIALYVANDFMRWFIHFLQHKIPFLWEFHKVHHSAEHLNFATAERFHPVDVLVFSTGVITAAALVNGIFIGFFGDHLTVLTISGANILWVGSNVIGGVLRHSPAWVSFGPRVERWLISPAMHQIHHSDNPRHFDKNMGGSLAIWDRLAGTLYVPEGREVIGYGLGEETKEYRSLVNLYVLPFKKAFALIKPKRYIAPAE